MAEAVEKEAKARQLEEELEEARRNMEEAQRNMEDVIKMSSQVAEVQQESRQTESRQTESRQIETQEVCMQPVLVFVFNRGSKYVYNIIGKFTFCFTCTVVYPSPQNTFDFLYGE